MDNQNPNNQTGQQTTTINVQVPSADNIASRRPLIPVSFALAIIFFFFTFCDFKCGGQKIGSVTGINLVTGTELKDHDMFTGREIKGKEIPSSIWAIFAFGAAIIGLGAFLIKEKREAIIGTGAGVIGVGSLIILQFAIKNAIDKEAQGKVDIDFQFPYWGALLALGVAGLISYLRMKKTYNFVVSSTPPIIVTPTENPQPQVQKEFVQTPPEAKPPIDITEVATKSLNSFGNWIGKNKKKFFIGGASIIAAAIIFYAIKFFLGLIAGPDAFIGNWTSYNGEIRISKQDKIYQIDFLDNTGQTTQTYQANKVDDLLSYRDNSGNGKQIKVYVPVNTKESKEGKIILDYKDSLHIRLITDDGDYFMKFESKNKNHSGSYVGTWKTKTKQYSKNYEIIKIDSTSQGVQVSWIGDPTQIWTPSATFQKGLLNIGEPGVDGGIYATYFQDCDCITIGNDKYYRYDENDERFLGYWKNNDGEIKISKNGNYYLVRTHQFQDYTFDFMTEVKGNTLQEPLDKYATGKTYTTITYLSPGVISDNGGGTKYYNSSKYSRSYDYSYNSSNNTTSTTQSTTPTATTKSFTGNVGKLQTSYSLTWNSDGTIYGTYYYPNKPNNTYTLKGKDLGNGNIQLTEYTGSNVSANCNLSLQGNCYVGQMNNTDGRAFKMTMCQ